MMLRLLPKITRSLLFQSSALFVFSLLTLALIAQVPFTYTVEVGQSGDEWAVRRGFGERENNGTIDFRWTTEQEAQLRLPDVGWPSRIGLTGIAPRPDNKSPAAFMAIGDTRQAFSFGPSQASFPPDQQGNLSFEIAGPRSRFDLTADTFTVGSDLFQPPGDPRSLGLVISKVYAKAVPSRLGLIVPPLASWLGGSLLVGLIYFIAVGTGSLAVLQGRKTVLLAAGLAGICLIAIIGLRLAVPSWWAVNSAGILWGTVLPLLGWTLVRKWLATRRAALGLAILAVGTLLVYYGVVLAPFAATLYATSSLLFLAAAIRRSWASHLENIGLLTSLSAPVAWGLWQGQLPRTDDIPNYHLFWINELHRMIEQGNFYPRWAPDFSWGQGGQVFNFYGPLSRYLVEAFHLLGMTFNSSAMLTQWAATIFGAIGCYLWSVELLRDRRAAVLGGLAFCYFPYNLAGIYASGAIGNTLAGAFLPWVYWQMTRLFRQPRNPWTPLWLGLAAAGIPLSNNPQSVGFVIIGSIYVLGLAFIEWRAGRLELVRCGLRLIAAGLIAFGLSAFFLLPAVAELPQVGLIDATAAPKFYAVLPEAWALWRPIFPNLLNYALFGTLHYLLAAAGLVLLLVRRTPGRPYFLLCGLVLVVTFCLQLPASNIFWELSSALATINFSSRLLASAIVFAAPLIASLALWEVESRTHRATLRAEQEVERDARQGVPLSFPSLILHPSSFIPFLILGLMVYASFHSLTYAYWRPEFDGSISKKALTEQLVRGDVVWLPKELTRGDFGTVSRYRPPVFDDERLPGPADKLTWRNTGPDSYILEVAASRAGVVTAPLFHFSPDLWEVKDEQGRKYTTASTPRLGLMTFEVSAGQTAIRIKYQDTLLRSFSNVLSIFTLLGVASYLIIMNSRRNKPIARSPELAKTQVSKEQAEELPVQ